MNDKTKYISFLYEIACNLSGNSYVPVDLEHICTDLGIKIIQKDLNRKQSYLASLRENYEIHIPLIGCKKLSPWHRYLVAHELGHFFLIKDYNIIPKTKRDYWETDFLLCDYFARVVLLPDNFVQTRLERSRNTPKQRLSLVAFLAKRAEVTWSTAAHRITDFENNYAFFRMKSHINVKNNQCYKISVSTLKNRQGIGKIIGGDTKIYQLIAQKLSNKGSVLNLDSSILTDKDVINEFSPFKNANSAIAIRSSHEHIDIAVQFSRFKFKTPSH